MQSAFHPRQRQNNCETQKTVQAIGRLNQQIDARLRKGDNKNEIPALRERIQELKEILATIYAEREWKGKASCYELISKNKVE